MSLLLSKKDHKRVTVNNLEKIALIRERLKDYMKFTCHCSFESDNFDDYWNHVLIRDHGMASERRVFELMREHDNKLFSI